MSWLVEASVDDREDELISLAKRMQSRAYAPYSKFSVGSAVLTDNGDIFEGFNIENISYGATVCAERVAIWNAIVAGATSISIVAVALDSEIPSPCGICRQVMSEFGVRKVIGVDSKSSKVVRWNMDDLFLNPPEIEFKNNN